MKTSELKQLIKEEIRKVVSENEEISPRDSKSPEYKKIFQNKVNNLRTFQPSWMPIPGVNSKTGEFTNPHMMKETLAKVEIMFEKFTEEEGMSKEEALKKILDKFNQSDAFKPNRDWSENHLKQKYKF